MKILVVTQYFWPENFRINDLCDALVERGHDVTVYTGLPNYPEGSFYKGYSLFGPYHETRGKIKIIRSPLVPRGKNKSLRLAVNYFSYFFFASLLAPFLIRGKFDKIFVYEPSPVTVAIPGIVLKYLKRAPMFFWVTDLWPESLEATGVVKNKKILSLVAQMVRILYKHSDKILVTSKGFIPKVRALGVADEKIIYWPQWAESFFNNKVENSYEDKAVEKSGFKVLFAGNIGSSQDFPTLIEAAHILRNEKIHFMVLGDGLMKTWAQDEVSKRQLGNTFHFLGKKPLDTMPYYFSKVDALLVSLTGEELFSITVPSKVQSYLASGKPIIASLNGEGASIIDEWEAGVTCPASMPKLLAERILALSQKDSSEISKMKNNSYECYLQNFEREKLITQLESIFRS